MLSRKLIARCRCLQRFRGGNERWRVCRFFECVKFFLSGQTLAIRLKLAKHKYQRPTNLLRWLLFHTSHEPCPPFATNIRQEMRNLIKVGIAAHIEVFAVMFPVRVSKQPSIKSNDIYWLCRFSIVVLGDWRCELWNLEAVLERSTAGSIRTKYRQVESLKFTNSNESIEF